MRLKMSTRASLTWWPTSSSREPSGPIEAAPPAAAAQPPRVGSAGGAPGSAREHRVEALVAFADAVLHTAGDERVASLERIDQRCRREPSASVAEILQDEALQGHAVGEALEGKGLDDELRGADLVKAAVEAELVAVADVQVAVRPACAAVVMIDAHLMAAGPEPLHHQLGVGVRPEDLRRGGVELPDDAHERHVGVGGDLGLVGA